MGEVFFWLLENCLGYKMTFRLTCYVIKISLYTRLYCEGKFIYGHHSSILPFHFAFLRQVNIFLPLVAVSEIFGACMQPRLGTRVLFSEVIMRLIWIFDGDEVNKTLSRFRSCIIPMALLLKGQNEAIGCFIAVIYSILYVSTIWSFKLIAGQRSAPMCESIVRAIFIRVYLKN